MADNQGRALNPQNFNPLIEADLFAPIPYTAGLVTANSLTRIDTGQTVSNVLPEAVINRLKEILRKGSAAKTLTREMVIRSIGLADPTAPHATLEDLLNQGNGLIDALFYVNLEPRPTEVPERRSMQFIPSGDIYCVALFSNIYSIIVLGKPLQAGLTLPMFLTRYIRHAYTLEQMLGALGRIDLNLVDWSFVKTLTYTDFGPVVSARFTLGIAGYRAIRAYASLNLNLADIEVMYRANHTLIMTLAARPCFDIHPMFRTQTCAIRGSINKNIYSLLTRIATEEQRNLLIETRMVPRDAFQNVTHINDFALWPTTFDIEFPCNFSPAPETTGTTPVNNPAPAT